MHNCLRHVLLSTPLLFSWAPLQARGKPEIIQNLQCFQVLFQVFDFVCERLLKIPELSLLIRIRSHIFTRANSAECVTAYGPASSWASVPWSCAGDASAAPVESKAPGQLRSCLFQVFNCIVVVPLMGIGMRRSVVLQDLLHISTCRTALQDHNSGSSDKFSICIQSNVALLMALLHHPNFCVWCVSVAVAEGRSSSCPHGRASRASAQLLIHKKYFRCRHGNRLCARGASFLKIRVTSEQFSSGFEAQVCDHQFVGTISLQ